MSSINRRRFLKLSGAGLLLGSQVGNSAEKPEKSVVQVPAAARYLQSAPLPPAKGARVVVVGGGWSGLTMAKYLKRYKPDFDVVLIDRKSVFVSCPLSNIWLADQIDLEFLSHSYFDAAATNDYLFLNAGVVDVDRESRKVFTDRGHIAYDYLVLAPGIDYDYSRIGIEDPAEEYRMRMQYPAGFTDASEYLAIKRKLHNFERGTFALTVPVGNYRCMAAPYERACMAAAIFKKRGIKAKVLLLDMNPDVRIKKDGFLKAFSMYYEDTIEYVPSTEIAGVDLDAKEIQTDFDSYEFDDAVIYPPIRASRLIEELGMSLDDSPQKEADVDLLKYHLRDDERVYITGDSRPQPFSKSGNTAQTEAQYVAEVIAAHAEGREIEWRSPQTMCFSGVKIDPLEAMSIIAFYKYNQQEKSFAFDRVHKIEKWSDRSGQAGLAWAEGMYRDLFYR